MPDENGILTYNEVLELLSRKARDGSVTAMAALERALRLHEEDGRNEVDEALNRILGRGEEG
jgi:predicted component of type VI protein secretion system